MISQRFYFDLGTKIRQAREAHLLSQQQLAFLLNKSRQMVNYYENGTRKIPVDKLAAIATILQIPTADLLPHHNGSDCRTLEQLFNL